MAPTKNDLYLGNLGFWLKERRVGCFGRCLFTWEQNKGIAFEPKGLGWEVSTSLKTNGYIVTSTPLCCKVRKLLHLAELQKDWFRVLSAMAI